MDTRFAPELIEKKLMDFWEGMNYGIQDSNPPFTILMPPPNANASLHAGHGMYVIDDILIRWKILKGFSAYWIPGMDHAGFETQYVYEKHLAKQGKSRMDFDRKTLYENIFTFVKENSGLIYSQFKRLGFAAQWKRSVFMLDKEVVDMVFHTFFKMEKEQLIYRDQYMVNYCTKCGTTLAELEVSHVERVDPLYYIKYGPLVVATVRPETKFGDTALAVHPDDVRYKKYIGKTISVSCVAGTIKLPVIADTAVDPKFGTGVLKVTPAHDPHDFEIGKIHKLSAVSIIDNRGRLTGQSVGAYAGIKVKEARKRVVADLTELNLIEKIDTNYTHTVTVCYKCNQDLEPMIIPNWFIKVNELKKPVIDAVKTNSVAFTPKKYKKQMLDWLEIMHDWPISRQVAWGIRIPVWYEVTSDSDLYVWWIDEKKVFHHGKVSEFLAQGVSLDEIEKGLQRVQAPIDRKKAPYVVSSKKPGASYLPETDTFDTWFSSSQWPLVTLQESEYKTRFPTDVMGTLSDILKFWISRMMMFSLYVRKEVPFKQVYLWSMVADAKGNKMSKSKGNVVNPIDLVEKYGADAFRASLLFGSSQGGKVILSEDKVRAMRNFANKIWNMGRFLLIQAQEGSVSKNNQSTIIKTLQTEAKEVEKKYERSMKAFRFSTAFDLLYHFMWHRFADFYIEQLKDEIRNGNIEALDALKQVYERSLKLLHPFMPFITEAVWQEMHGDKASILLIMNSDR